VTDRRTLLGVAAANAVLPMTGASAASQAVPPERTTWRDAARKRDIPVLIRRPAGSGPAPLVLLSHGLGGSREGLAYLGEALAAAGYIAVHLQHRGSDAAIWQGAADTRASMGAAVTDIGAALARLQDVVFALDTLLADGEPLLRGWIDPGRIAIAGHSYGAWTVSHMLGERLPLGGFGLNLPDPRLRAGIALSPIPPLPIPVIGVPAAVAYQGITAPILHVTGTRDSGMGVPDWRSRTVGYRTATSPGLLAVLDGAVHASLAGEAKVGGYWNDPTYQPRTARLACWFLNALLRGDAGARTALLRGEGLAPRDTIESKGIA